jgi:hypothetical protein
MAGVSPERRSAVLGGDLGLHKREYEEELDMSTDGIEVEELEVEEIILASEESDEE